jgi:hypothetical protein
LQVGRSHIAEVVIVLLSVGLIGIHEVGVHLSEGRLAQLVIVIVVVIQSEGVVRRIVDVVIVVVVSEEHVTL